MEGALGVTATVNLCHTGCATLALALCKARWHPTLPCPSWPLPSFLASSILMPAGLSGGILLHRDGLAPGVAVVGEAEWKSRRCPTECGLV